MLDFTVSGLADGGSVTLEVFVPYDPTIDDYYKMERGMRRDSNEWTSVSPQIAHLPVGAPTETRLRFTLSDGAIDLPGGGHSPAVVTSPNAPSARARKPPIERPTTAHAAATAPHLHRRPLGSECYAHHGERGGSLSQHGML